MTGAFWRLVVAALALASSACHSSPSAEPNSSSARNAKQLVILGVDGMDPKLTAKYMKAGRLPALSRLAARGSFLPLETVEPPQSPVAWSAFSTGLTSAGHGIFDFVLRDPRGPAPKISTSRLTSPASLALAGLSIPLGSPVLEPLREGPVIWQLLEQSGVPAVVIKMPANFPPAPSHAAISTSDMGTPDLLGTYGTNQIISSERTGGLRASIVHPAIRHGPDEYRAQLTGPPSPWSVGNEPMRLPVRVRVDALARAAVIELGDTPVVLREGEWSEWTPVEFDAGPLAGATRGIVRILAQRLTPELTLYFSPINMDPVHPALPLSSPPDYIEKQARQIGRFFTQGLAEDTAALISGALTDDEFLSQAQLVFDERRQLLEQALDEYRGGLLFFYISSVDLLSHVFWRAIEPGASPADARYAEVIPHVYESVDRLVELVSSRLEGATLVVMSDHGFAPYRYQVNLNRWLMEKGYLNVDSSGVGAPAIEWNTTRAYALGLNQIFVNVAGRESRGIVPPEDRREMAMRLANELESWRHDETGAPVVTRASIPDAGGFPDRAPDLFVGFNSGYRSSDASALGELGARSIEPNLGKWSGDHCMDPRHVPGVLISSEPIAKTRASLEDFMPTVLEYFGAPVPPQLPGGALW